MTPVSSSSIFVFCSTRVGAGLWIGYVMAVLTSPSAVNRFTYDVEHPAEDLFADRDGYLCSLIDGLLTANKAIGRVHGNATDRAVTHMLGNLKDQVFLLIIYRRVCDVNCAIILVEADQAET